jgi:hypothetical protein
MSSDFILLFIQPKEGVLWLNIVTTSLKRMQM